MQLQVLGSSRSQVKKRKKNSLLVIFLQFLDYQCRYLHVETAQSIIRPSCTLLAPTSDHGATGNSELQSKRTLHLLRDLLSDGFMKEASSTNSTQMQRNFNRSASQAEPQGYNCRTPPQRRVIHRIDMPCLSVMDTPNSS